MLLSMALTLTRTDGLYGLRVNTPKWGTSRKGRDVTLGSDPPGQEGGARASLQAGEGGPEVWVSRPWPTGAHEP